MKRLVHHSECTQFFTATQSLCSVWDVAKFKDIVAGISRQTSRKCAEIARDNEELNRLRESYQRFNELSERVAIEQKSAEIGLALVFNAPLKISQNVDAYDPKYRDEIEDASERVEIDLSKLDLSNYSLWRIMREILRQVPEMRVYELEAHLRSFGIKAERSAIESALLTHNSQFRCEKRGREKFVSLK